MWDRLSACVLSFTKMHTAQISPAMRSDFTHSKKWSRNAAAGRAGHVAEPPEAIPASNRSLRYLKRDRPEALPAKRGACYIGREILLAR